MLKDEAITFQVIFDYLKNQELEELYQVRDENHDLKMEITELKLENTDLRLVISELREEDVIQLEYEEGDSSEML